MTIVFDKPHTLAIVKARLEHLATLGLPLEGRSMLEVGCGVGNLTGFFEERGCDVVCTEGRPGNVEEFKRRWPDRTVHLADLEQKGSHDFLGRTFDVVLCYGVLYHLANPALCLRETAKFCSDLFLLETTVHPADNGRPNLVTEPAWKLDQSVSGQGCRPARDWIWNRLERHYEHVYLTRTQPRHPWFPLRWPNENQNARAVFVASRRPLNLLTLSPTLLEMQTHATV